ncbi:DNA-processing protein DprA [Priestia megaterium]|uniref:DNA-processing protein DprA n=1 Tax=Priestia megaterium TaxID=1404 RepID=UPI0012B9BF22|nr:DNA-processing protein DprA [Priestia megaterium]
MNNSISEDSYAILLLCSTFGLKGLKYSNKGDQFKPFTPKEWINLSRRIIKSGLGRPSALFNLTPAQLMNHLNLPEKTADRIYYLLNRTASLTMELENLSKMGIWVTTRAEPNYPVAYKRKLKSNSPTIIYGAGNIDLAGLNGIGIVGSRDVEENGKVFTEKLAMKCASENLVVISGGSRGVDMIAQEAALKAGGKVVAVLSDSLAKSIQKKEIRAMILSGKLLLMSAFHPNSRFTAYNALGRNKHIYGLSKYTVVTSSDFQKGGTWKGAVENLEENWVPMFVRGGNDVPKGNEELIRKGVNGISIDEVESNEKVEEIFKRKLSNDVNFQIETENNVNNKDIFYRVWPIIEESLTKSISEEELARIYSIEPTQVRVWVKKALALKKIKYVDDIHFISSVFYNKQQQDNQLNLFNSDTE